MSGILAPDPLSRLAWAKAAARIHLPHDEGEAFFYVWLGGREYAPPVFACAHKIAPPPHGVIEYCGALCAAYKIMSDGTDQILHEVAGCAAVALGIGRPEAEARIKDTLASALEAVFRPENQRPTPPSIRSELDLAVEETTTSISDAAWGSVRGVLRGELGHLCALGRRFCPPDAHMA